MAVLQRWVLWQQFKSKVNVTGNTHADDNTKNVEIIVPLKYLRNVSGTLEMRLIIVKSISF